MTLRVQIIALTVGLAAVLIVVLTAGAVWLTGRTVADQIGKSMADLAAEMADRLDRDMTARIAEVDLLVAIPTIRDNANREAMRALIDNLQDAVPLFSWIGLTDSRGTVIAASDGVLEGKSIAARPVFTEAQTARFVGDVHDAVMLASLLPNPTGEPVKFVDISQPIFGPEGDFLGVLATHLSWVWAGDVRRALLADKGRDNAIDLFVVASDGTFILSAERGLLGRHANMAAVHLAGGGRGWRIEEWPDGSRHVTGFARMRGQSGISGFGWTILARQPIDQAFAPAYAIAGQIALFGFTLLALSVAVGWVAGNRVIRPLRDLTRAVEVLRERQGKRLAEVKGPREVQLLARAFRRLIETLSSRERDVAHLTDKAHTDPLTGLANRAALELFLGSTDTAQSPHAVLAVDLDGFKAVNDLHGHEAGDELLRHVAVRLRGCLREDDALFRVGGDEFLVFIRLQEEDEIGPAHRVAERIVGRIAEPFEFQTGPDRASVHAGIGASVGLAFWPHDGERPADAMALADRRLYAAKRRGKSRVVASAAGG